MPTEVMEFKYVGRDQVTAEMRKIRGGMSRLDRQMGKLTGQSDRATSAWRRQAQAVRRAGKAVGSALSSIGKAGLGVMALGMTASRMKEFVIAGEQASNVATRFAQVIGTGWQAALGGAQRATAGLVEATDLQIVINRFARLGVDVQTTTRLLELSTKAAIDQGRSVLDVARVVESSLKGRTTGLVDIGVNLDKITGLTQRYAEETGVATGEVDEMTRRLKVALPAALQALGDQFDEVDLKDFQLNMQQTNTAFGDFVSDAQSWVAEGWGDAMRSIFETARPGEFVEEMEQAQEVMDRWGETAPPGQIVAQIKKQSDAARSLGEVLAKMPEKMRLESWDLLRGRIQATSPQFVRMIEQLAGIEGALAAVSAEIAAMPDFRMPGTVGGDEWWQGELRRLGVPEAPAPKPRRGGGGGGRKAREAAMRKEVVAGLHLLELQQATTESERVELEYAQKRREIEAQYAPILKSKLDTTAVQAAKEARLLELQDQEIEALSKIEEKQDAITAAIERARHAREATVAEHRTMVKLAEIEQGIAASTDPLVQAELQLRSRLVQINADRLAAGKSHLEQLMAETEMQIALTAALADYSRQVEQIESQQLAESFNAASGAMSNAQGVMSELNADMGVMMGGVSKMSGVWSQYAAGQISVADAAVQSAAGMGASAAQLISDQRARAGVHAAIEAALAVAAYARASIAEGAAHTLAAGMFAAVAAGAGGGGASAGGGGAGGAPAAGTAAGPPEQQGGLKDTGRQVIVQLGSGVILGSAQAVAEGIRQAEHASRGTGHQAGW